MTVMIGIDPGKLGALAVLFSDDSILTYDLVGCYDDSGAAKSSLNPRKFHNLLSMNFGHLFYSKRDVFVCCEKPIFVGGGFTIRTPMSMFESFGVFHSVFDSLGVPFRGVAPREWIRFYSDLYHPKKKRDKSESVKKAMQLFPSSAHLFEFEVLRGKNKGSKVGLDGRAEAVLIANYARSLC